MKIKFIEQWKFRLIGRSVPVMRVSDIDKEGRVHTLMDVGTCKDRPNSIVNTYDEKGWEKAPDSMPVIFLSSKGTPEQRWIVSESGETVNLYTKPVTFPNLEEVIGHAATMDDIADSMDLGKSMRNLLIGMFIGIGLGAFIIGPMLTKMLS